MDVVVISKVFAAKLSLIDNTCLVAVKRTTPMQLLVLKFLGVSGASIHNSHFDDELLCQDMYL